MNPRKPVQSAYDRWSASYDSQPNPTRDLDRLALQSLIPSLEGKTVLEIGCGTGKNTQWLAPQCARLIGLDFSGGMLSVARQKIRQAHVHFVRADIDDPLPMRHATADVALINLVLEHIGDIHAVIRNAAQHIKPGGVFILSEYHPDRLITGKGARIEQADSEPIFVGSVRHPVEEFEAAIRGAGLNVAQQQLWYERQLPPGAGDPTDDRPLLVTFVAHKAAG